MPEELDTYRLLKLNVGSLTEIDESPALRLQELLEIDDIYKEAENASRGPLDAQRDAAS